MRCNISKFLKIELLLNSSEAIMFTKGGKHTVSTKRTEDWENEKETLFEALKEPWDVIEISVQLERNEQGRFDFITGEAENHKQRMNNETQSP